MFARRGLVRGAWFSRLRGAKQPATKSGWTSSLEQLEDRCVPALGLSIVGNELRLTEQADAPAKLKLSSPGVDRLRIEISGATFDAGSATGPSILYSRATPGASSSVDVRLGSALGIHRLIVSLSSGDDSLSLELKSQLPALTSGIDLRMLGGSNSLAVDGGGGGVTLQSGTTLSTSTAPTIGLSGVQNVQLTNAPAGIVFAGTSGDDLLSVRRQAGRLHFGINNVVNMDITGVVSFGFDGGLGSDKLVVDYSGGNPLPATGVSFSGGDGAGSDSLEVTGSGTQKVTYLPSATTYGSGVMAVDNVPIYFAGLEPAIIHDVADAVINFPNAADVVDIANGLTGGIPALQISGTSNGVAFETAFVYNVTNVNIDTVAGGVDGNDTVTITSANNAHNNQNFIVNTGFGTDSVTVAGAMSFAKNIGLTSTTIAVNATITSWAGGNISLIAHDSGGAADNIAVTADINAVGGDGTILLSANDSITQSANVLAGGAGDILVFTSNNSITMSSAATTSSNGGNIAYSGNTGIAVGSITTTGSVALVNAGASGQVTDANAAGTNVTAASLLVGGRFGVGSADALETAVSNLGAGAFTSGNLQITNSGALDVTTVHVAAFAGGFGLDVYLTGVEASSGSVALSAASIKLSQYAKASATVSLTATAGAITDNNAAANNVTAATLIAGAVTGIDVDTTVAAITATTSGAGSILVDEVDAVTLTNVTTANGPITITTAGNTVVTNVVSTTDSDANDIGITASVGDITVTTITAGAVGDVTLKATTGNIFDDGSDSTFITADVVTLTALRAVGAPGATPDIDTTATSLVATTTGTGFSGAPTPGIWVTDTDALTVTSATTQEGVVFVDGGTNLIATLVDAGGTAKNVRLRALNGDLTVASVTALGDTVTLQALLGNVFDDGANATVVSAGILSATAFRAIGQPGANPGLDTTVTSVTASTTGTGFTGAPTPGIWIADADDLTVTSATTAEGVILIDAAANLVVTTVDAGGTAKNVRLQALGGNLTLGSVSALGDSVLLNATGSILDGDAAANNVTALNLALKAGTAIASSADPLETTVSTLAASATTGGIFVANTGALSIGSLTIFGTPVIGLSANAAGAGIDVSAASPLTVNNNVSAGGDINLKAGEISDATVWADKFTLSAGISVVSTGGNIVIRAGDDIVLQTGFVMTVPVANSVTLLPGDNDLDGKGSLLLEASDNAENFLVKRVAGGGPLQLKIDAGAPMNISLTAELQINAKGGSDQLIVDFTGGPAIPAGGIQFFGGDPVVSPGDSLSIIGSGSETVTYTPDNSVDPADRNAGTLNVAGIGNIRFRQLEPINVNGVATFNLNLPGAADVVNVANGFDTTNTFPALVISGTSGGLAFETAHVFNCTTVNINTVSGGSDGIDSVTINSASVGGNTNFTVFTGANNDLLTVAGAMSFAGFIDMRSTTIVVNASITSTNGNITIWTFDGGTATDNITVGAAITASGAVGKSVDLNADDNLIQNANVSTGGSGDINVMCLNGNLTMAAGASTSSATGSIAIFARRGNAAIATVSTAGGVIILSGDLSASGAITDANAGAVNVTADRLVVDARTGASLDTAVGSLAGTELSAGDLNFRNTGSVQIDTVAVTTNATNSFTLTLNGFKSFTGGNIIVTATGDITVNQPIVATGGNGGVTLTAGSDLTVNDTGAALGISTVGTGAISLTAGRALLVSSNSVRIDSIGGNITLRANRGVPVAGNFVGINSAGSITTVNGAIVVDGRGGDDALTSTHTGVLITAGGKVIATGTGAIQIIGAGGIGTESNLGIAVSGLGTQISAVNGDVTFDGTAQGTVVNNYGVLVYAAGTIKTTGTGKITITGTSNGTSTRNVGVFFDGAGTQVTTTSGDLVITGTANGTGPGNYGIVTQNSAVFSAGGAGKLTLTGTGGPGASEGYGVAIALSATVSAVDGALTVEGTGRGSAANNIGVVIANDGLVQSTGVGTITVIGHAPLNVVGIQTQGAGLPGLSSTGTIRAVTGDVTLQADMIVLGDADTVSGAGQLFVKLLDKTRGIKLGGAADVAGNLTLTTTDLAAFKDGFTNIQVGNVDGTGAITTQGNAAFKDNTVLQTPGAGSGGVNATNTIDVGANSLTLISGSTIQTSGAGLFKALSVTMTAVIGINVHTDTAAITATTSGAGSIVVDELDAVTLTNVTAANGPITITTGGNTIVTLVVSTTDADANDISITASVGDITVTTITAGAAGDVTLMATSGSIFDDGSDATVLTVTTADVLTLTVLRAIGQPGANPDLDTTAASLVASTTGTGFSGAPTPGIWVIDTDALTITSATTQEGVILIDGGTNLIVTLATAAGAGKNIRLRALGGNLTVGVVTAAGDTVLLTATASIIDGNGGANNVTALNLEMQAGTAIAASTDALDAVVSTIAALASNGGIFVANTGALTIGSLTTFGLTTTGLTANAAGAAIEVSAASPLTANNNVSAGGDIKLSAGEISDAPIWADDFTLSSGVSIVSTSGNILITAGDDIILPSGFVLTVPAGKTVDLLAAFGDLDGAGSLQLTATDNGELFLVKRAAGAGGKLQLTIDAAAPLNVSDTAGLTISALGGTDRLRVDYANGAAVPVGGILFFGGNPNVGPGDSVALVGTGVESVTYTPDTTIAPALRNAGTLTIDDTVNPPRVVTFRELEPVDVSSMAAVTLRFPGANDVVDAYLSTDFGGEGQPALRLAGTSDGIPFETIALRSIGRVLVDTTDVMGVDRITSSGILPGQGIGSLKFRTGKAADALDAGTGIVIESLESSTTLVANNSTTDAGVNNTTTTERFDSSQGTVNTVVTGRHRALSHAGLDANQLIDALMAEF